MAFDNTNAKSVRQNWTRTGGQGTCGEFKEEEWPEPGFEECGLADKGGASKERLLDGKQKMPCCFLS